VATALTLISPLALGPLFLSLAGDDLQAAYALLLATCWASLLTRLGSIFCHGEARLGRRLDCHDGGAAGRLICRQPIERCFAASNFDPCHAFM